MAIFNELITSTFSRRESGSISATSDKISGFSLPVENEFFSLPGNQKTFLVMKNTSHAKIPLQSWEEVVAWLDKTFAK